MRNVVTLFGVSLILSIVGYLVFDVLMPKTYDGFQITIPQADASSPPATVVATRPDKAAAEKATEVFNEQNYIVISPCMWGFQDGDSEAVSADGHDEP